MNTHYIKLEEEFKVTFNYEVFSHVQTRGLKIHMLLEQKLLISFKAIKILLDQVFIAEAAHDPPSLLLASLLQNFEASILQFFVVELSVPLYRFCHIFRNDVRLFENIRMQMFGLAGSLEELMKHKSTA